MLGIGLGRWSTLFLTKFPPRLNLVLPIQCILSALMGVKCAASLNKCQTVKSPFQRPAEMPHTRQESLRTRGDSHSNEIHLDDWQGAVCDVFGTVRNFRRLRIWLCALAGNALRVRPLHIRAQSAVLASACILRQLNCCCRSLRRAELLGRRGIFLRYGLVNLLSDAGCVHGQRRRRLPR